MAQYKALVGAIVYKTESADGYFTVELSAESEGCELPEIVLGVEMVLLVNLIRKATKKNIVLHNITVRRPFDNPGYEKFLGYQDLNSFYRAFSLWTGKSITEYKAEAAK